MNGLSPEQTQLAAAMGRAARMYDLAGPRFFSEIAARLVSRVDLDGARDILDVGTGPGVVLAEVAQHVDHGTRLVGVDFSVEMVDEARRRLSDIGRPDAEVVRMDAERLELRSSTFDAVFCSAALYQLPHPERAAHEFHRVLRSGGVLALSIFGADDPRWEGKNELFGRLAPPLPRVGASLTEADLRSLLARAGFARVQVEQERLDVLFADADAWLEKAWSHGERRALDAMSSSARARFRAELPPALEKAREDDGELHWRPEVVFATAHRP